MFAFSVLQGSSYGDASLVLSGIKATDRGWYNCKVLFLNREPHDAVVGYIIFLSYSTAPVIYIDRFQLITTADVCPIFGQTTAWDQTYTHNYSYVFSLLFQFYCIFMWQFFSNFKKKNCNSLKKNIFMRIYFSSVWFSIHT